MARTFVATCAAAALGVALTASAQPPQPQPSQPTPPAQGAPPAQASATLDREVKLSGCLKAGSEAGSFELATGKKDKMARGADAATPAQPPASTAGQAPAQDAMGKAMAKNVKLMAAPGVNLAAHLNHQIEVAGSWEQGAAGAAAGADAAKAGKTFNVASVKMISSTCTTGTS